MFRWQANSGGVWVTHAHDLNGSRVWHKPPNPLTSGFMAYYYDGLGQTTGIIQFVGGSLVGGAEWCRYDALGRRVYACDNGSTDGLFAFDGDNVIRTTGWRYLHGPGVDDPLVGLNLSGSTWVKYFYLTDGRGRLLAFTDTLARNVLTEAPYQNGGNQAGAIHRSTSFANTRAESPQAPGVSFYRNRYYDQTTGRWTQEDPIGISGGVNLYQYVGNNPATLTDPFGLCPAEAGGDGRTDTYSDCPPGTSGYRQYLSSMGTIDGAHQRVARSEQGRSSKGDDAGDQNTQGDRLKIGPNDVLINCPAGGPHIFKGIGGRFPVPLLFHGARVISGAVFLTRRSVPDDDLFGRRTAIYDGFAHIAVFGGEYSINIIRLNLNGTVYCDTGGGEFEASPAPLGS